MSSSFDLNLVDVASLQDNIYELLFYNDLTGKTEFFKIGLSLSSIIWNRN